MPTLYTKVEITSDTLEFREFCIKYTLSKPIFTMLAQLKISIVITVGRMHGISTCQIL